MKHSTCGVCNLHTQDKDERGIIRSGQVIADQPSNMMLGRNKTEPKSASQVWNEEYKDEDTSSVFEAIVQKDTCQDRQCDEDSVGDLNTVFVLEPAKCESRRQTDLHQSCHQGGKPKPLNNDSSKVGNTAIGNVACFC